MGSATPISSSQSPTLVSRRRVTLPIWLSDALPIIVAYIPIAFAFGLTAREAGLPWWVPTGMSVFVFAGASQMIAVGLIAAGQSPFTIILTTLLINSRMLLLGAALTPLFTKWTRLGRVLFGLELTDESFAALAARFQGADATPRHAYLLNASIHGAWLTGTVLGYTLSGAFVDVKAFGLDFALCGMLIGMLCLMVRTRRHAIVGMLSGFVGVLAAELGYGQYAVVLAAAIGPTAGVLMERIWPRTR